MSKMKFLSTKTGERRLKASAVTLRSEHEGGEDLEKLKKRWLDMKAEAEYLFSQLGERRSRSYSQYFKAMLGIQIIFPEDREAGEMSTLMSNRFAAVLPNELDIPLTASDNITFTSAIVQNLLINRQMREKLVGPKRKPFFKREEILFWGYMAKNRRKKEWNGFVGFAFIASQTHPEMREQVRRMLHESWPEITTLKNDFPNSLYAWLETISSAYLADPSLRELPWTTDVDLQGLSKKVLENSPDDLPYLKIIQAQEAFFDEQGRLVVKGKGRGFSPAKNLPERAVL